MAEALHRLPDEIVTAADALLSVAHRKAQHCCTHRRHPRTPPQQLLDGAKQHMVHRAVALEATFGVNISIAVILIPYRRSEGTYNVRVLRVYSKPSMTFTACFVHAADLGGVVERKSNIARMFGKYTSPEEKVLATVPGAHNHTIGQISNALSVLGVKRFLQCCGKMRTSGTTSDSQIVHFRSWIEDTLLPLMACQPKHDERHAQSLPSLHSAGNKLNSSASCHE
jgi:hypothetical protein